MNTSHAVEADEIEGPERRHQVDLTLIDASLQFAYGLTETFDLTMVLPMRRVATDAEFFDARGTRLPGFASIHHRDEVIQGLGDLGVGVGVHRENLGLHVGLSLPTGDVEPDPYALGRLGRRHQHIFFGSGTVNPSLALSGAWHPGGLEVRALAEVSGAVYENPDGYRAGWSGLAEGAVAASLGLSPFVFVARLGLMHVLPSEWNGTPAENTGRTDLLPGVAVEVPWGPGFIAVDVARPVNLTAEGGQLDAPFVAGLKVGANLPVTGH